MYALPRNNANNKFLVKTRRGVPQTLDTTGQRESSSDKRSAARSPETLLSPKPVFHVQGRKSSSHAHKSQSAGKIDPQHKELVKYIHETWKCVKREYERDGVTSATSCLKGSAAEKSAEPVRRTLAKDFQPFDLEAFWGRRLFEKLTN